MPPDLSHTLSSLIPPFISFTCSHATPHRVINRAPGLKLVVQTLLSSLRPIGNIVLICCTFFIIFGILGVQVSRVGQRLSSIATSTEGKRKGSMRREGKSWSAILLPPVVDARCVGTCCKACIHVSGGENALTSDLSLYSVAAPQLFKGTFYYCEGADVRRVKTKADCLADPRNHWVNRKYNFDNLGQVGLTPSLLI